MPWLPSPDVIYAMLNQQIISSNIQPANFNGTVQQALELAHAQEYTFMPVTNESRYLGIIPTEILEQSDASQQLSDIAYRIQPFGVKSKDHIFRAAALFTAQPGISFIPVTDDDGTLAGFAERSVVFQHAGSLLGLHDTGALIVLEMDSRSFSVGELSKLVETNDAQITQLNTSLSDQGRLTITLRVNTPEVSDIVATLQRYDYSVIYFEGEELYQNQLRQNYESLMNFLEM